jgi:hypothetical protein
MDMKIVRRKSRKIDRRTVKKLVFDQVLEKNEAKERLIVNTENVRLLLADPDFQAWAREMRKYFGIPPEGFKSQSAKVRKWIATRDDDIWFERVSEIFMRYTKINEQFRIYVDKYIVFNNDFQNMTIKPFDTYTIGRFEIMFEKLSDFFGRKSKKIPQMVINIYVPPIGKQWDKIISDVNEYFDNFDIPTGKNSPRPVKNLKLKLIALKPDSELKPATDFDEAETYEDLIQRAYPKSNREQVKKMARNLPRERENTKVLLVTRLGKTEINLPATSS